MFCPQCGQERTSIETNYCSRCGLLLTGFVDLLQTGGLNPLVGSSKTTKALSPRRRGIRQGLFIFLLTFLFAPLVGIISLALRVEPFGVGIVTVLFFIGGFLRMIYALMFESPETGDASLDDKVFAKAVQFHGREHRGALPPETAIPAANYTPPTALSWRDTNDLVPSVTEGTTKLLEKDDPSQ